MSSNRESRSNYEFAGRWPPSFGWIAMGTAFAVLAVLGLGPADRRAFAQAQGSIDIEVGSRRIGGPGTDSERPTRRRVVEEEVVYTEENLPPKGSGKRLLALHSLAEGYVGGHDWKSACDRYDVILEEGGEEGLLTRPEGRRHASRSYEECAEIAVAGGALERARALLSKSERLGSSTGRHAALHRRLLREDYRFRLSSGDIDGAIAGFAEFQAGGASDEDERIWFGEQLAMLALDADKKGDDHARDALIEKAARIAPMNTDLRRLTDRLKTEKSILARAFGLGAIALLVIMSGRAFSQWRGRRRLQRAAALERDVRDEVELPLR